MMTNAELRNKLLELIEAQKKYVEVAKSFEPDILVCIGTADNTIQFGGGIGKYNQYKRLAKFLKKRVFKELLKSNNDGSEYYRLRFSYEGFNIICLVDKEEYND